MIYETWPFILQYYNGDRQGHESSDVGLLLPTDRQEGPRGGYRPVATARLPYGPDKHKPSPPRALSNESYPGPPKLKLQYY